METVLSISGTHAAFHIGEQSEVAAARRGANELAGRIGLDETRAGQLALLVTEAATNIVKHAGEGEILLRPLHQTGRTGVEVLALDAGPGMANLHFLMEDGISTAGTYGVGLGTIRRLAHEFDVYTAPGKGTALMVTLWSAERREPQPGWEAGAVCLPMPGEEACGDTWGVSFRPGGLTATVADGLGHGPEAARASTLAVAIALDDARGTPANRIEDAHGELRSTRGAAVAVCDIDADAGTLSFVGVGNIAATVFGGGARKHLLSHNGIVGSNLRKVQEFQFAWDAASLLVLHSDGVGTRWDLDAYPGLYRAHASLIAAVLYRDFRRGCDDATVLVVREQASP